MCSSKCFFHTKHWIFILGTSAHMPRLYCMLGILRSFWVLGTLTHSGDRPSWEEPSHNFYISSINIDMAMESDPHVDDVPMFHSHFPGEKPCDPRKKPGKAWLCSSLRRGKGSSKSWRNSDSESWGQLGRRITIIPRIQGW